MTVTNCSALSENRNIREENHANAVALVHLPGAAA